MNIIIILTLLTQVGMSKEAVDLIVIVVSVVAGTGIFFTAGMLWRTGSDMSRVLAVLLFTVAMETVFATIAVPYRYGLWAYAVLKCMGRGVQLAGIGYFLWRYTKQDNSVE